MRGVLKKTFLLCFFLLGFNSLCFTGEKNKACFNKHCFKVEIADTPQLRLQGLMDRDQLPEDQGMLFIFDKEEEYGFWMKNTLIPLDIIWLNNEREVVFIKRSAQPCEGSACSPTYPERPAKYVIELSAGRVGFIGLEIGDKFDFIIK